MTDVKRHVSFKINSLLELFPVVAIIGPRQSGKSTISKQVTDETWDYYDLERPDDFQLISSDPVGFFKRKKAKVIIDEAQQYPQLFEILRGVIDQDRNTNGRFILTGSSSPEIVKGLAESLAGRIATIELAPFKATEFYKRPLSEFYKLISNGSADLNKFEKLEPSLNLQQVYTHWFLGGYPEPRIKGEKNIDYVAIWKDQYFNDFIKRDIANLFPRLNSHRFRLFIQTLSFHSGTSINKSNIARSLEINSVSVGEYLEIIHATFLWRNLRSFEKNSLKKIQKMPRGFFRDSGILHHLLKIQTLDQLLVHPQAGFSFESFVTEEIIRGISCLLKPNSDFYFYRTKDKSEIDLIIDSHFGLIPIEIKLGHKVDHKMLRALKNFIRDTKCPYGILVNSSDRVEFLADNIIQIPVGCL